MNFILPSTAASLPLLLLSHLDHCSAFAGLPFPLPSSLPQPPLSTRAIANEHNNNHQGMIISLSSPLSTRGTRRRNQVNGRRGKIRNDGIMQLYGISEWRDQSLESYYSLEAYQMQQQQNQQQNQNQNRPQNTPSNTLSAIPSKIPILPFPFPDLLFPGQRTQLNLYESRFHSLFQDVMENYAGVVAMGLLTGSIGPANTGMITTLPLCEVESYSRMGGVDPEKFVDRGDGMGNGSIFVSIRAVGRVKIMEGELERSDPYMVGRVREMMDEELVEGGELEEGSRLARDIETVIGNLARLEKKWKDMDEKRRFASSFADGSKEVVIESKSKTDNDDGEGEDGDSVMNRRLLNAQLESLFMMDDIDNEGIILEEGDNQFDDGNDDEVEDDNDCNDSNDDEDYDYDDENDNQMNRLAQFHNAIQMAMEADSHGYVTTTTATTAESSSPFPSSTTTASNNNSSKSDKLEIKTPKELTAISWAAFCTSPSYYATSSYAAMTSRGNGSNDGSGNDYFINIAQDVFKIQALDMTNVLSRMKLALAMLREEEKKLIAKLALKGIANDSKDEDEGDEAL